MRPLPRALRLVTLLALIGGVPCIGAAQASERTPVPADDVRLRWPAPRSDVRGFRLGSGVVVTRFAPVALPTSPFARCLASSPAAVCATLAPTVRAPRLMLVRPNSSPFAVAVGRRIHQTARLRSTQDTVRPGVVRVGIGFPF